MPVKMMCIAPHGSVVIPELRYYQYSQPILTTQALLKLRDIALEKEIEHFVVVDPHGKILHDKVHLLDTEYGYRGTIGGSNDPNFIGCIYDSNHALHTEIRSIKHPNFEDSGRIKQVQHISWGSYVPLYLIAKHQTITILTVDHKMEHAPLSEIVNKLHNIFKNSSLNIGLIFSADLSHAWSKQYPQFPYHSNSKVYDEYIVSIINDNRLEHYCELDKSVVDTASTCAHGPLRVLSEICKNTKYRSTLLSYEVPSYYGMSVAYIEPLDD